MKKFYRIVLFLVLLVFLSTYNPVELDLDSKKNNTLFKVKNLEIKNNSLISINQIKKKLDNVYEKNIFFIKKRDIEKPLEGIYFLKNIEVQKKYPNTLIISINETKPIAIVFKDKAKYFIDSSSNLIPFRDNMVFIKLPSVFGEDAEKNFLIFFDKLVKNNFPTNVIKNYYYFQIDRWDLQTLDNKTIKFPEKNISNAIIKSIELLNREDFKNYNIIDLRVEGKIIVE